MLRWAIRVIATLMLLLAAGFFVFADSIGRTAQNNPARADGIVALTGGEARIRAAVELLAKGNGRRLLISGVNSKTRRSDLERIVPGTGQLFGCCIDIGHEAKDTIGNADETRQWVVSNDYDRVIVVTSSYHMPRSLAELSREMPGVEFVPHAVVPSGFHIDEWWAYPGTARLLVSEYLKFLPAAARLYASRLMFREGTRATALANPDVLPRL